MVVTEPLASDTETGSKVDEAEIILLEVEPMFAATSADVVTRVSKTDAAMKQVFA